MEINKFKNYIILAQDFKDDEEYDKSFEMYQKAESFASSQDDIIDVKFEMADLYILELDHEKALNIYDEIIKMDTSQSGAYYGYALSNELSGGDLRTSISYYDKAIELDPFYDRAYYYASILYDEIGNSEKALEYLEKCIELDPSDYIAYNDIGSIYENKKEYGKALEYLEKSIEINDEYSLSLFNLGVVYNGLGNIEKALEFYYNALEYSTNQYIYLNISAIYIEQKEFDKSIVILTEGIEYNPNSVILYYNRSCSYSKFGDRDNAEIDFVKAYECDNRALDWAINDPDIKDLKEVIKRSEEYDNNKN